MTIITCTVTNIVPSYISCTHLIPTWEMQEGQEEVEEVDSPFLRRQHPSPMLDIGDTTGGGLQGVLGQLFSVLLQEIESFITFGERLDS